MSCLSQAWTEHARELRVWASKRLPEPADVEDFLQDLFIKSLRQGEQFCSVQNARAWLYEVARNTLADRLRTTKNNVELPEDLPAPNERMDTVDELTACLPRVLSELSDEDRDAISLCDLKGMSQADFAQLKNISLSAAKSRIQRARERLKARMTHACQVRFDATGHIQDFVPRNPPAF